MEITDDDMKDSRMRADVDDRIDMIFENYTLSEILEMNDLEEKYVVYLLYVGGHIKEPEAYFP